jgi:hypothetical protein
MIKMGAQPDAGNDQAVEHPFLHVEPINKK